MLIIRCAQERVILVMAETIMVQRLSALHHFATRLPARRQNNGSLFTQFVGINPANIFTADL
jgi:hypothetical protein